LLLYGQLSNTGTRQVGRLRQRFGLFHNQLTGNDDILNVVQQWVNEQPAGGASVEHMHPYLTAEIFRWELSDHG
jgi:hypothetical protein